MKIPFLSNFLLRFKNARIAIQQIRNGEWKPVWSEFSAEHLTAVRGDMRLWIGNGAFFCEINRGDKDSGPGALGLVWRHYVWWAAAWKFKRKADRQEKGKKEIPTI